MKSILKSRLTFLSAPWVAVITLTLAMSQTRVSGGPLEKVVIDLAEDRPPVLEVKLDSSYSLGGAAEFRGRNFGDSDAFSVNLNASTFLMLSERWLVPIELQSQNFSLESLYGLPVPDSINVMEFGTGLAYMLNDRWLIMARFNTALYKLEDINRDDIGFSGGLMVEWQYSSSLKWVFGVMYQPDNDLPVIPLIGAEWLINDRWELHVTFPQPRLIYAPGNKWRFHLGMDLLLGTTFRTTDTFGSSIGLPEFDNELGSYSDMRIAVGIGYQLSKSLSVEVEGGYSMSRKIEYTDIDEEVEFDPAPYFRVGLRYGF